MGESIRIKGGKPFRVEPIKASPCSVECPLGTNVKAYVSLIAAGRFAEALEVVRRTNPFPGICGRVCPHPCEDECRRREIDAPVSIAALKRFIADYELRHGLLPRLRAQKKDRGRVGVIGAGPAGLTCAADLAREGYRATVFEALPVAGGMMAVGIPPYRLPREILRTEIGAIEALGVDLRLNERVGERVGFDDIVRDFDAVFIATGAQKPRGLGVPGERDVRHGLVDWPALLRDVSFGCAKRPGERLVVVGGGNTAVDAARVALSLGTREVRIVYRRSRDEMPAYREEVADAQAEGIEIDFLAAPVRLVVEGGRLRGVECVRMRLGKRDETGRPRPVPVKHSEFVIPCDALIPAIGQEFDRSFLGVRHGLRISGKNLLVADPLTMATDREGVFAGGDAITGPASVVEAIASGHRGARSIGRYLRGLPLESPSERISPETEELTLEIPPPPRTVRISGSRLSPEERRTSFEEIERGLTETEAVAEAERCMRCGLCMECTECLALCEGRQAILESTPFVPTERLKQPGILVRVPPGLHRELATRGSVPVRYRARPHEMSVFTAVVDPERCRGCGLCEETCGYRAARVLYQGGGVFTARVDQEMCRGCGACVAVCPSGAMGQNLFTPDRIDRLVHAQIEQSKGRRPVVVFACRWNPALRLERARRTAEVIEVMCTGRITGGEVLRAFERGSQGVLVIGCTEQDCHYGFGRARAEENLRRVSQVLSLLGIETSRLRTVQAPIEGALDLAELVEDFISEISSLGTNLTGGSN
ncbi:MAG: FAD-dependent oxidoreductase [Deltaproteobacteria bacterium]|nr:FAD-dependent oxidoreductase [Deltaproteobacteria bacterium]